MLAGWSGPIDPSAVLLLLTGVSLLVFAMRLARTPRAVAWDWWVTLGVVVAIAATAWLLTPAYAGWIAFGAFAGGVLLPLAIDRRAQRASRAGEDGRALRLARLARALHPFGLVGRRARSFDAYGRIAAGAPLDDATMEALGVGADPILRELARVNALALAGLWPEVRQALTLPARRHRILQLGFGSTWVRAVGRTAGSVEIAAAVEEAEKHDSTLVDPDRRAMLALEGCSALGDVEGTRLVARILGRGVPAGWTDAAIAWSQKVAGDLRGARATVEAALQRSDLHVRGLRALTAVAATLTGLPPGPPPRSPQAEALVVRLRREAAAAEALAPLAGRGPGSRVVTFSIAGACTLAWVLLELAGGSTDDRVLYDYGGLVVPLRGLGDAWRLLSCTLLHAGPLHLAFNMIALLVFGRFVEAFYGRARMLAIYVLSALASGSLVAVLAKPDKPTLLVGASGAIMGLGGAVVAALGVRADLRGSKRGRDELRRFGLIFALQVVMDNLIPAVSGTAHLGGFLGGALAGALMVPRPPPATG